MKVVATVMVTLLVKGGCGDHGGGGHTGGGNRVEPHVLVVMMAVVTLVVGSVLAMKILSEKAAIVVAGKLLSIEERVCTKPLNSMALLRGSNSNWVCGNSISLSALAVLEVPFSLGWWFLLTSQLFCLHSSRSHILPERLPGRRYILGG